MGALEVVTESTGVAEQPDKAVTFVGHVVCGTHNCAI